jgi:hypothetical protein
MQIADQVIELCRKAAAANRATAARRGNIIELTAEHGDELLIAADLHGNRLNFNELLRIADLAGNPRRHLVMQEVCHGGPEYPGGGCMSHLMLEDCARLKTEFPSQFHFLLSNHELAELGDFPICKSRKMLNLNFRCGLTEMYGDAAEAVRDAYMEFLATCPLAIRLANGIFVSHSVPEKVDRDGFDVTVFERPLTCADWRAGSPAFRLVWGRDFRPANVQAFADLVQAELIITGHEPCVNGFSTPSPRQLILDSCCKHPSYVLLPVHEKLTQPDVVQRVAQLHKRRKQAVRNESQACGT